MELYYFRASSPCRAVLLFVRALNLNPTMKEIDITKGENLTPEYLKLNPQHTIPLIVDGNFVLSESPAILVYLAEQYGENYSYCPNDSKARGVINQRLMFDIGTLYPRFWDAFLSNFLTNEALDVGKVNKLKEAFEYLESFMGESTGWLGMKSPSLIFRWWPRFHPLRSAMKNFYACGFDLSKYKKVTAWLERCESKITNYKEINQKGANILGNLVKEKLFKASNMQQ